MNDKPFESIDDLETVEDAEPRIMGVKIRFDSATEEWFRSNPFGQTTVCQCERCGLHYKPSLGHKCKKGKNNGT